MEPFKDELKPVLTVIDKIKIDSSSFISGINDKLCLLMQYKNNALTFYYDELFFLKHEANDLIVIGYDVSGYFVVDEHSGYVHYLCKSNGLFNLMFCNSDINKFINFNNLFVSVVIKQAEDNRENNTNERIVYSVEKYYGECDILSMVDESNFWPTRTYELSECFYPLDDSRIKLYKKLFSGENDNI